MKRRFKASCSIFGRIVRLAGRKSGSSRRPEYRVTEILNYLSDEAGFVIEIKPNVPSIDRTGVGRNGPPTDEEDALQLLRQSLARVGCMVLRKGRTLSVITNDDAKKNRIPLPLISTSFNSGSRSLPVTEISRTA